MSNCVQCDFPYTALDDDDDDDADDDDAADDDDDDDDDDVLFAYMKYGLGFVVY